MPACALESDLPPASRGTVIFRNMPILARVHSNKGDGPSSMTILRSGEEVAGSRKAGCRKPRHRKAKARRARKGLASCVKTSVIPPERAWLMPNSPTPVAGFRRCWCAVVPVQRTRSWSRIANIHRAKTCRDVCKLASGGGLLSPIICALQCPTPRSRIRTRSHNKADDRTGEVRRPCSRHFRYGGLYDDRPWSSNSQGVGKQGWKTGGRVEF